MLKTHASSTCAMVEKAATQFSPDIAAASATSCTSAALAWLHWDAATPNVRAMLMRSATATATVV